MKPIYNRVVMTIPAGQTSAEKGINVDPGERVFVLGTSKPSRNQLVAVGLFENGTEIHPKMDISHYDGGIGTFEQRGLMLAYRGGSMITVKADLKQAETDDTQVEIVFLTYKNQNC